jgi:hypothetical protein
MKKTYGHFHQVVDEWYLVPENLEKEFICQAENFETADSAESFQDWFDFFDKNFSKYRLSSGVESYRVLISE